MVSLDGWKQACSINVCGFFLDKFWQLFAVRRFEEGPNCGPSATCGPRSVPSKDEEVGKVQRVKQSFEEPQGVVASMNHGCYSVYSCYEDIVQVARV